MYSAEERQIFRFHDGKSERAVDPIATLLALRSVPDMDFNADWALMIDRDDVGASQRVLAAARQVFGIAEFSEDPATKTQSGMLAIEVQDIVTRFLSFVIGLKKNTELTPTLPEPMGSTSDLTTQPTAVSG